MPENIEEIFDAYDKTMETWSAENGMELSTSYGYIRRKEYPDSSMKEIAKLADDKMYEAKDRYYELTGKKRRV